MIRCPNCGREWPEGSEYGTCVELLGECVWCHFHPGGPGTEEESLTLRLEHDRRRKVWVWVPVPNPRTR